MSTLRFGLLTFVSAALFACGSPTTQEPPPQTGPITSYILPGQEVFPEGITYNPVNQSFYVSSTTDGTIFRGTLGEAQTEVFLPPNTGDGRSTAVGLKVDDLNRLYIAGGRTGRIFVYDTNTKTLLRSYDVPVTDTVPFVNDVALTPNAAYFTDSFRPLLYRIPRGPGVLGDLEPINLADQIPYGEGFNLNGIAATPDGRYLLVVQSNTGQLYRIDTLDGHRVTPVTLNGTLAAGDGILLDGQTLYVVRNRENVIVPVDFNADYTVGDIDAAFPQNSTLQFPTTIAKTNGRLLVVNSQFNKQGEGQQPDLPFTVSSIPIPQP